MPGSSFGTKRSRWAVLLLSLAAGGSPATANTHHPEGWNVSVRSTPVSKQGMHDVVIVVRDAEKRPVSDARVELRLHSTRRAGYRLVAVKPSGRGEYRTWVRLHSPWDNPRRLQVQVTPRERR